MPTKPIDIIHGGHGGKWGTSTNDHGGHGGKWGTSTNDEARVKIGKILDYPKVTPNTDGPKTVYVNNTNDYSPLLGEIQNLAKQKYDAQINLINQYLQQQKMANQQDYERNRDQAEVNYFNGLRRMREQYGNTNGYNDSGLNRTNNLYFNTSRANTNADLRRALNNNNLTAEYNAQNMRANATNNYYDDYQTYLNMLNKYIK